MTYAICIDITAPIEMYTMTHQQLLSRAGLAIEGLLVHLTRSTTTGFQIIEVWSSKERVDYYNQTLVWPLMAELAAESAMSPPPQIEQEFEVRGLVLPSASIAF